MSSTHGCPTSCSPPRRHHITYVFVLLPIFTFSSLLLHLKYCSLLLQPLGYKVTTAFWAANIVGTALIVLFVRRDKREAHIAEVARENDENGGGVKGIGIIGGDGVSARGDEGSSVEDVKVR